MTVTSKRLGTGVPAGSQVEVVTPEGVPLVFTIASLGERVYAFTIDAICIAALVIGLSVLGMTSVLGESRLYLAFVILAFFLLRNGWFMFFELRRQGRTPGKRRCGTRVIDANGGPLQPMSLVVRNLTRELEVFLPLVALASPEVVATAGPGWVRALSVLWTLGVVAVPLIDRRRRRLGDLLAGTMVVREPHRRLERDLGTSQEREPEVVGVTFSARQLEMYGVYELQVLEKLLREEPSNSPTFAAVAKRVVRKIGWEGDLREAGGAHSFLATFYRAQRARLEHDLTLGRARERKRRGRIDRTEPDRARPSAAPQHGPDEGEG